MRKLPLLFTTLLCSSLAFAQEDDSPYASAPETEAVEESAEAAYAELDAATAEEPAPAEEAAPAEESAPVEEAAAEPAAEEKQEEAPENSEATEEAPAEE